MPHTYILQCADDTLYVGSTWNLDQRLWEHETGKGSSYTRRRLPVRLIWSEEYDRIADAYDLEKRIQGWSHAKRLAFIAGGFEAIVGWSRNHRVNAAQQ
ncbi:MAG TPA: GIY-YIG nuclease family protein [Microbacterium sp.]|nr:GIY-YIG nuclease family protein [Microbacterium sp.]